MAGVKNAEWNVMKKAPPFARIVKGWNKKMANLMKYPCDKCKRVKDPEQCDNKRCGMWNSWFLQRWSKIHGWYLKNGGKHELEK